MLSKLNSDLGICEIANDNSESQIIISGHKKAVSKIEEQLKNLKKRSIFLPVSAPFHCSLMKLLQKKWKKKLI